MMMAMAMATAITILSTYESSTREGGGIVAGTIIVGDAVVVEVRGAAVVVTRKAGAVPRGNTESWSTGGNVSISI